MQYTVALLHSGLLSLGDGRSERFYDIYDFFMYYEDADIVDMNVLTPVHENLMDTLAPHYRAEGGGYTNDFYKVYDAFKNHGPIVALVIDSKNPEETMVAATKALSDSDDEDARNELYNYWLGTAFGPIGGLICYSKGDEEALLWMANFLPFKSQYFPNKYRVSKQSDN